MRRAAKVDSNQQAIVAALRKIGCLVVDLSAVGEGCPDLLVYSPWRNALLLMEIKDGDKVPSKQKLTPQQSSFHGQWKEAAEIGVLVVVHDVDEAVRAVTV